ncbi:hypothetical protein GQX74_014661 [Glossina fuscipes]|nr:hypothetical protein GQX74_014661 [Glossina fuscipes]
MFGYGFVMSKDISRFSLAPTSSAAITAAFNALPSVLYKLNIKTLNLYIRQLRPIVCPPILRLSLAVLTSFCPTLAKLLQSFLYLSILLINSTINNNIELFKSGSSTRIVLPDIKAAFDSFWRDELTFKMFRQNFPREIIEIPHSFLKDRCLNVHLDLSRSHSAAIGAGCPQESFLLYIPYNIFIADHYLLNTVPIFGDTCAILNSPILLPSPLPIFFRLNVPDV